MTQHTFLIFEVNGMNYTIEQIQSLTFADNPTVLIWYCHLNGLRTNIVNKKYRELFGR